ncbi:unnamed protein product [Effrenium voratum]|nr:unnamed protein product [Effrenium voratum]
MVTIIGPAVVSAFSFGYLAGRAVGSYNLHKHIRIKDGLNSNRVFVAVVPEQLFEAGTVARELELAISRRDSAKSRRAIELDGQTEIMKQQNNFPPVEKKTTGPTSLNKDSRRKELLRITRENQSILKRIQQAQPVYNHVEWEDQHRKNVTYLKNKCEFPVVLRTTPRRERYASSELVNLEEDGSATSRSAPATSRVPPKDLAEGANQKYVLKEGMKLSDTYYLVDMSTDGRNLFISAYDNGSSTTLELVIKDETSSTVVP